MKIAVVGTGYVGLVAGTCFAEYGNEVYCVDVIKEKIENLKKGILPIYEPGLSEMVLMNHKKKRLKFTTDLKEAVENSDILFIAVGTPDGGDGKPDLSGVRAVAKGISSHMNGYKIIVDKSTVPVGTADQVKEIIAAGTKQEFDVVSNPEFLREGRAIEDFMKPERIVIGAETERAGNMMKELYDPFVADTNNPILVMGIRSAELTKYACNTFLAMKISFANAVANLCDEMGADFAHVKLGLGTDSRIGNKFLNAGIGYGGSCFPKDVRAMVEMAKEYKLDASLFEEIEKTNESQKVVLLDKIKRHYLKSGRKDLNGIRLAVWGLAFKPGTDDMREAPSIPLLKNLHGLGATLLGSDPVAEETSSIYFKDYLKYGEMYEILDGVDALLVLTEWPDYLEPDYKRMKKSMKYPMIFDGRNIYKKKIMREFGFDYVGIGRS